MSRGKIRWESRSSRIVWKGLEDCSRKGISEPASDSISLSLQKRARLYIKNSLGTA